MRKRICNHRPAPSNLDGLKIARQSESRRMAHLCLTDLNYPPCSSVPGMPMDPPNWETCDDPEQLVPVLLEQPSMRKLRLLACALVRHAPYDADGRTIWDLLPSYDWSSGLADDDQPNACRNAIRIAELRADGLCGAAEWQEASAHAGYAVYSAEADTFGYDPDTFPGSNFRYAAAIAVKLTLEENHERLARYMFHYLWYMRFDPVSHSLLHPENRSWACQLTREVFGNPFRPVIFMSHWNSPEVLGLASRIYQDSSYDLLPALGGALQRSGCEEHEILRHCCSGFHVKGCWVVDRVLDLP